MFVTCSDRDLLKASLSKATTEKFKSSDFTSSQIDLESNVEVSSDVEVNVELTDIDKFFLQADEDDYTRWEIDTPFFDNETAPNDVLYMQKVCNLLMGDWDELPLYDDHMKRYYENKQLTHN